MPAGRKGKLTPEVQRRICDAIAASNYHEAAAAYGGIDVSTFCRWMEKGKEGRPRYREFRDAVLKAQAEAEVAVVALWRKAIPEDWRAARDLLARRHPERWGPKERRELSTPPGEALKVEVTHAARRDEVLAILERFGIVPPPPEGGGGPAPDSGGEPEPD